MPENIQRVKKITLTEKIQVKEKIDEEEIIKIREKVSAEINQLNQELVSEVADAENIKKIVNELTDLKEVDEFRKLYLKTIITNYLERVGGDYKAFLVRKDIIEEAEVVAILLHNQQLFIEISLNRQTTNSSIADVMAEIYQEKKRVIDQSINDLTLVKKGLIPKLQSEVFSLIEKIIALEQKLESQSAQLTQSGIFLQLAKEEIERLYKENGELYVELDKFSEAREKFAEFEWQLENQKEQIASFQEQLRNKDLVIEDKEKAI
ncbi:16094_t:CDS:1, partial [Racocetra persica]